MPRQFPSGVLHSLPFPSIHTATILTSMHITFGLRFDGRQGPSLKNSLGDTMVGPSGLLGLLETYLGLATPALSASSRVTSFLGHLQRFDNQNRFYSRSFAVDSVGTAAELLAWRDEWCLAGWTGNTSSDAPPRIREMAMLEELIGPSLFPGEAERLSAVIQALLTERTPIQSVSLVNPMQSFPAMWRRVLELLPNVIQWTPTPNGRGALREVQEKALLAMSGKKPQPLSAAITDESLVFVKASTREMAEHWFSILCQRDTTDRLLVCESSGDALDATLSATGYAASGFKTSSELRPALQALGLAIEMCWDPIDVGRLVDFLSHPIGPFSRSVRNKLARAVSEQPGIGGPMWETVKETIAIEDNGESLNEDIAFWLEGERWDRKVGIPLEDLTVRVNKLLDTFLKRLTAEGPDRVAVMPAITQCSAMLDGLAELKTQGVETLSPRQIEQLLTHSTPSGATNPFSEAQVGSNRSESAPGNCIESAEEVIWWMPSTPALPKPLPWSEAEVTALAALGVELRDPQQELRELANQWLLPLLAARKTFTLVLPPAGSEEHPLRQLLVELVPGLKGASVDLDSRMGSDLLGHLSSPLTQQSLPEAPSVIRLNEGLTISDRSQSFSSLTELFNSPALTLLKRKARLRAASVLSAEEDNKLLGTLAHRVFETLFQQADALTWTNDQATTWFKGFIEGLLRTEGALLLMHGAGVNLQSFKSVCERAMCVMLNHLRAARAVSVRTEVRVEGLLGDVPINGSVDLVVELPGQKTVALDMKWGGDKHHTQKLRDGTHLQLALYESMLVQQEGKAPDAVGYFILVSASMYVTAPDLLPTAQVCAPPPGSGALLLKQALDTWKWRSEQWAEGHIDVVPIGASDEHQGPEGTLHVNGPASWDMDHLVLLGGWEK